MCDGDTVSSLVLDLACGLYVVGGGEDGKKATDGEEDATALCVYMYVYVLLCWCACM